MQRKDSRHTLLGHACWLALCYLLAGAELAVAQGVTHIVNVGPPPGQTAHFVDFDSGSASDIDPAITVIRVGDTVRWDFFYTHSSTSGLCDAAPPNTCNPNGTWDSDIKTGPFSPSTPFQRTFTSAGVFPYFCRVHLSAMRGAIVVLNSNDYDPFGDRTFLAAPMPSATIFAGQTANFDATFFSFLSFSSLINLSCSNGDPRVPATCLNSPLVVDPANGISMNGRFATQAVNVPVSESVGGDYSFDIKGDVTVTLSPFTHSRRVLLHVNDLGLMPASASLTALRGDTLQTTVQAESLGLFSGTVSGVTCDVTPAGGPSCSVTPNTFPLGAGASQNLAVNFSNTGLPAILPNNYSVNLVASSSANNPGPGPFTRSKSFTLALKPAVMFKVETSPPVSSVAPGTVVGVLVTALNPAGNTMTNYNSTIHFSSSDPTAALPPNYPFQGNDNGVQFFNVTFNSAGPRTLTVTDTTPFATTGTSAIIRVDGGDPTDNDIALTSSLPGDAYFQNENVTFTAAVTATPSGTPQGSVQFFDGATPLGAPVALAGLGSTRTAQKTLSLAVGDHPITAVFQPAPASGFTANVSAPLLQRRSPAPRCVAGGLCPGSH